MRSVLRTILVLLALAPLVLSLSWVSVAEAASFLPESPEDPLADDGDEDENDDWGDDDDDWGDDDEGEAQKVVEEKEAEFDRLDRVTILQEEAVSAVKARDWARARETAEIVLTLDDTEFTTPSRLALIRALEGEGNYAAALYELGQYTALPISPWATRRAERLELRLQKLKNGERQANLLRRPARLSVNGPKQRPAAVAMLLGGLAATVTGSYFIGTDIFWSGQDVASGTWAMIGTPLLVVGVGLDIGGIALLVRSGRARVSSPHSPRDLPRPTLALGWDGRKMALTVGGRW